MNSLDWQQIVQRARLTALLLRQPVMLVASRLTTPERARMIVGWASGPAEEWVRVGTVLLFVGTAPDAIWVGIGWAGIEVVAISVNALVISNLLTSENPKALKVKAVLREQGRLTTNMTLWAAAERCSATALHVGFTLLLFAQPWWVLITMIAHSSFNIASVHYAKRSARVTELGIAVVAIVVLLCGLAANGEF